MKKMNFTKLAMVFALLTLFVTGCSSSTTTTDKVAKIKEAGVIKIGTNSGYPPYEFYLTEDGKKELAGYDVDIANAVAKELGVKVEWVDTDFDALVPSLMTDKFDIVLAGMVNTEERQKSIDFSDDYYDSETVVVAPKDKIDEVKTAANLKGKKIVVQSGTTQVDAASAVEGATVNQLPSVTDTIANILSNQSDALFIAEVSAKNIVAQNSNLAYAKIEGVDEKLLKDGAAIGIKKGNDDLKTELNKIIKNLKDSGELDKMFIKNQKLAENNKVS
ncbi:ABC transporter substrate-binding protein [Mycoplasma sp. P36-A1]|uniref:ABC transporter substrate-binding protein n=1 Tax=Mycoplasma sp. P36-A1 TaxID=3252900 RepID=UPI003C2F5FFB